ncbi:MAG: ATP-binding cassette domain-containing protein [Chloroflexota bacterium]|nr:MAG: ATP-binding cassette domain-containing protein [Chloroflexota bacterium]
MPLLQVERLTKAFGGILAVNDVSFAVETNEIVALIGPNGAGKTTLFNLISGVHAPTRGDARFDGRSLGGLAPYQRAALGLARTFQNLRLFENMTVVENVMVGFHQRAPYGMFSAALRLPKARRMEQAARADALERLDLIGLRAHADEPITMLPFGKQRLVQIARALAGEPRLLLLDEPAAGLTRGETDALDELIQELNRRGITILIVEHDMRLVMNLAQRVVVLNFGEKLAEGNPREIQNHPQVIAAYLGTSPARAAQPSSPDTQNTQAVPPPPAPPLLEIKNLTASYGSLRALDGISLHVNPSEIVAIVGANGAGKTTLVNTIAGLLPPRGGSVRFNGKEFKSTESSIAAGIVLVPERRQIFSTLTVRENLLLGAFQHRRTRAKIESDMDWIFTLFPILKQREHQLGGTLSGGEQQMLAIARGMMSRPRLLMLDEPSVGLAPLLVQEILRILCELRACDVTVLLIEQNAQAALSIADRAYVFETGRVVLEGTPAQLAQHENIQRAYLGALQ